MVDYLLFLLKSSWKFSKKALLVVVTYVIIFGLFIIFSHDNSYYKNTNQTLKQDNLSESLTTRQNNNQALKVYKMSSCFLTGDYCSNSKNIEESYRHSVAGFTTAIFTLPYTHPPASFTYWAINGLHQSGFIPKTYAIGSGFASIRSLIPVWSAFRDIAYVFLVVVLVAIGFMIMFRMKLNPQTVINVENSLPRIIITLILITFSFAIAGLLIDLMYITTAIVAYTFAKINNINTATTVTSFLQARPPMIIEKIMGGTNLWKGLWNVFTISDKMFRLMGTLPAYVIRGIVDIVGTTIIYAWLNKNTNLPKAGSYIVSKIEAVVGTKITGLLGGLATRIGSFKLAIIIGTLTIPVIIGLIILLTVVFAFFRILFMVISSYIKIIILIIFSPLFILANALPGRDAFSSWLKDLTVELLTFPLLATILMVGYTVINTIIPTGRFGVFSPPPLFQPPFMFGVEPDVLSVLIGMAILFMTPDLIVTGKKLLVPKSMPLPGFSPGVFFGGVSGLGAGVQAGMGFASIAAYTKFGNKLLEGIGIHLPTGVKPSGPGTRPT